VIHAIKGQLIEITPHSPAGAYVLLEWQNCILQLSISSACLQNLPALRETCCLYTSLSIKESGTHLYGFSSRERRDMFNLLQSTSGVGPKMALNIVDQLSVGDIVAAVSTEDYKPLTVAKGVGPKLAQKIVLELKDIMMKWRNNQPGLAIQGETRRPQGEQFNDAENVLLSLGYTENEIAKSFKHLAPNNTASAEEILQSALKQLALQS
jgi:holliday junction DNA helicase RuvA